MDIIKSIEHEQLKNKIPELKVGNTVRVHVRIKEGNKERIQVFEGIIIKVQGGGVNQTFTVRKTSYGVGVEKTFLVHSPLVEKVELVRVGKARRAKLFYLRDRIGKSAKTKEQIGARIEDKEIVLKEELAEEEPAETAEATETTEVTEVAENTKTTEESKEVVETVEAPAEEKEEAKAEETAAETDEKETVEEAKKEEPTEAEEAKKDEPAKEESVKEKSAKEDTAETTKNEDTDKE